jgi:DNA modification methylase
VPRNSLEHILLFSRSAKPAWDITRMDMVDRPPRSQRQLAADAARADGDRPSGYKLSERSMQRRGDQRLPGNLIVAGGGGNSDYSRRCKEAGIAPHPARFPEAVPRQIILLASDRGDTVYDPMAGSNTTGKVALDLGRRFIASEPMLDYVRGGALRFDRRGDFRSHK